MSRRRVSCPQITQQLWDAIKTIRYQRQVPDIDRISRYMSRVHNVSQGKQSYCYISVCIGQIDSFKVFVF